jgi:exosortase E/protease (VPEID-CTERM system)
MSGTTVPSGAASLCAVGALLTLEFAVVAIRHWWVVLLGDFPDVTALVITFVVATVVLAGDRYRQVWSLIVTVARPAISWSRCAVQVLGYAGFLWYTRHVVANGLHNSEDGVAWFAGWVIWGIALVGLGVWIALPLQAWGGLGRRVWKEALFAGLVVLVAWLASRQSQYYWRNMADDTLRAVEATLRLFYTNVTVEAGPRVIRAEGFGVMIAPSCSGFEGFGLVAAVVGCFLWLGRHTLRFPAALLLLPLALAASWVFNIVRIAALIAIGAEGWPVIAVNGFHTKAGWLAFNAVALGVILLGRVSPWFSRRSDVNPNDTQSSPAAPYLVPFLAVVAAGLIAGTVSDGGVDRFYGLRVIAGAFALIAYRARYGPIGIPSLSPALGVGVLVFALWIAIDALWPATIASSADPYELPETDRWLWLVTRVFGAVVVVPIVEELAFRGYLLRRLQGTELDASTAGIRHWPAIAASSLLFGLLHPGYAAEHFVLWPVAGDQVRVPPQQRRYGCGPVQRRQQRRGVPAGRQRLDDGLGTSEASRPGGKRRPNRPRPRRPGPERLLPDQRTG